MKLKFSSITDSYITESGSTSSCPLLVNSSGSSLTKLSDALNHFVLDPNSVFLGRSAASRELAFLS